jgi:hypothetical protein
VCVSFGGLWYWPHNRPAPPVRGRAGPGVGPPPPRGGAGCPGAVGPTARPTGPRGSGGDQRQGHLRLARHTVDASRFKVAGVSTGDAVPSRPPSATLLPRGPKGAPPSQHRSDLGLCLPLGMSLPRKAHVSKIDTLTPPCYNVAGRDVPGPATWKATVLTVPATLSLPATLSSHLI